MANEYRFYQLGVEAWIAPETTARFYQAGVEVWLAPPVDARLYQVGIEVWHAPPVEMRLYQVGIEIWRSIDFGVFPDFLDEGDWVNGSTSYVEFLLPIFLDEGDSVFEPSIAIGILPAFLDEDVEFDPIFAISVVVELLIPTTDIEPNPYRPDVPGQLSEIDQDTYDYLRHQAETIREQHNLTQAGDTTFPWQMVVMPSDRKEFTLGSETRFFHEDYGVIRARFCEFSSRWQGGYQIPAGHTSTDWVATDKVSETHVSRLIGLTLPFSSSLAGKFGWIQTQGRNLATLTFEGEELEAFKPFTWNPATGYVGFTEGPGFGMLLSLDSAVAVVGADPPRWTLPAGSCWLDVVGVTEAYIVAAAREGLDDWNQRITALEAAIAAEATDYGPRIDALESLGTVLTSRISLEEAARISSFNSLNNRLFAIESYDLSVLASLGDIADYVIRLEAVEALTATHTSQISSLTSSTGLRLDSLELWKVGVDLQLGGIGPAIGSINSRLDSLTASQVAFVPAGSLAATEVQAALVELDGDVTTLTTAFNAFVTDIGNGYTFTGAIQVPDDAYGAGWNGSTEVPTKNAVYDKIESMSILGLLASFTVATLPSVGTARIIQVTDEAGGPTAAYTDGTNWRRVYDNAIVS